LTSRMPEAYGLKGNCLHEICARRGRWESGEG
jgi:hypothetical protein